ncbi:MAG: DMT family transporter [Alphaproteobacteria bacterium]
MVGAVAVGASTIFVRLSDLAPLPSAFFRPLLAVPVLFVWMRLQAARPGAGRRPRGIADHARLLLAGAFFGGDLAFWHLAIHHTSVANATLLANTAAIHVTVAGWLFFGRRARPVFLAGMGLAILGSACLVSGTLRFAPENLAGDVYGLITALFLTAYMLALERLRAEFDTATIMTWTSIGTAAVLFPVAMATGDAMISQTAFGWGMLLGLALVSHAAGQGLIAYALAHMPVAFATVGLLLETVAAAALAALILGEALSAWQIAGGAIVMAGIALARRGQ